MTVQRSFRRLPRFSGEFNLHSRTNRTRGPLHLDSMVEAERWKIESGRGVCRDTKASPAARAVYSP
jgi:hypothetical protein